MSLIADENNIKLAYRNIKSNKGSYTAGVDKRNIKDVERLEVEQYVEMIQRKLAFYKPKAVKRVDIPKPNGKIRPLGIPTIVDRLVQQCILQVLEPICEAKFHERNNGFRPNRSTEHALAQSYRMIQQQNLHFVVDIDIKGFFDNVNHSKLIKQMWHLGIRDKKLICIIKEMLRAEIIMPDGSKVKPTKGTPQGGILSPILSNIVLNELDWWLSSQWETMKTHKEYTTYYNANGGVNRGYIFKLLKQTNLKELYFIRYADDFKIFCRTENDAHKIFYATEKWLFECLKLEISEEKSRVVNLKKEYSEFLGVQMKAVPKGKKYVVHSNMTQKAVKAETQKLKEQIKKIQHAPNIDEEIMAIKHYNSIVWGIHNYYQYATNVIEGCRAIQFQLNIVFYNRLGKRMKKVGVIERPYIKTNYGRSEQIRFISNEPICPVGYIRTRNPMYKKRLICKYTKVGREEIHKNLQNTEVVTRTLKLLSEQRLYGRSISYFDNRISLYSAQKGKCAVTKKELSMGEIHCHHKIPVHAGGTDMYNNLLILHEDVHKLIHATKDETIGKYMNQIKPNKEMLEKINQLRVLVNNEKI